MTNATSFVELEVLADGNLNEQQRAQKLLRGGKTRQEASRRSIKRAKELGERPPTLHPLMVPVLPPTTTSRPKHLLQSNYNTVSSCSCLLFKTLS